MVSMPMICWLDAVETLHPEDNRVDKAQRQKTFITGKDNLWVFKKSPQ